MQWKDLHSIGGSCMRMQGHMQGKNNKLDPMQAVVYQTG